GGGSPPPPAGGWPPGGRAGASVSLQRARLSVWEPDTGRTRWSRQFGQCWPFVAFTKGGSWLVLQEIYFTPTPGIIGMTAPVGPQPLLVLDAATGKERLKVNGPPIGMQPLIFVDEMYHPGSSARAVSADGKTAAFSGFDGTIYLWDLATDSEKAKLAHPGPVHELAFSPDGRTLAAASLAAPVVLYDLSGARARERP